MQHKYILLGLALLVPVAVVAQLQSSSDIAPTDFREIPIRKPVEVAPLCPWRQPEADLKVFFPQATGYRTESPGLSGIALEIKERLGRWPTPDENPFYLHRVYRNQQWLGTVLVRRVKGEYGAIEMVLAVDSKGKVRKLHLQRLREPEAITGILQSPAWLGAFEGKTAKDQWQLGHAVPHVPSVARESAQAIVEGVRSMLILLETTQEHLTFGKPQHH